MPLMHGKSQKAFKHNVEAEMHAGKPQAQSLAIAYATKRRAGKKMAMGGYADGGHVEEQESSYLPMPHQNSDEYEEETEVGNDDMKEADMIARIMHQRKMYSKGGQVSNDVGVAEADKDPAEYDDLVLRDDDLSGADYDGENSGDMDGSTVSDDSIDRIMMKRKKDKLPRPA